MAVIDLGHFLSVSGICYCVIKFSIYSVKGGHIYLVATETEFYPKCYPSSYKSRQAYIKLLMSSFYVINWVQALIINCLTSWSKTGWSLKITSSYLAV